MEFQHVRPHGEEARHSRRSLRTLGCDARRLEPWQQVRLAAILRDALAIGRRRPALRRLWLGLLRMRSEGWKDSQPVRMRGGTRAGLVRAFGNAHKFMR